MSHALIFANSKQKSVYLYTKLGEKIGVHQLPVANKCICINKLNTKTQKNTKLRSVRQVSFDCDSFKIIFIMYVHKPAPTTLLLNL